MLQSGIKKMNATCRSTPSVKNIPQSEIDRIEADPTTLGWVKNPYGKGHIYFGPRRKFFSPTQPFTAEQWNLKFSTPDFAWQPAFGNPLAHYLGTAGKWARAAYFVQQAVIDAAKALKNYDRIY